jgi:hypothetical protein
VVANPLLTPISAINHIEILMSHFWAKFQSVDRELFRLDTRIYLKNIDAPRQTDSCIGAIVGKNPGSAKPSSTTGEIQPIQLGDDKLLPTVRSIITKAYLAAGIAGVRSGSKPLLSLQPIFVSRG